MSVWVALYVSADGKRTITHGVDAGDVEAAARAAVAVLEAETFGVRSAWSVGGLWPEGLTVIVGAVAAAES